MAKGIVPDVSRNIVVVVFNHLFHLNTCVIPTDPLHVYSISDQCIVWSHWCVASNEKSWYVSTALKSTMYHAALFDVKFFLGK